MASGKLLESHGDSSAHKGQSQHRALDSLVCEQSQLESKHATTK